MESLVMERAAPDRQAVALKAFSRIADAWSLTLREAAALADMSDSTWKRAKEKRQGFRVRTTKAQFFPHTTIL